MPTVGDPITHDIVVYQGTDHEWHFRRVTEDGTPLIPDNAYAEIRDKPNGKLWVKLVCTVEEQTGWVTVYAYADDTAELEWYTRENGVWDLIVFINGRYYRWVMGAVNVSQKVTKYV